MSLMWKSAGRRLRRPAMLVAAVSFTACLLPGEPSDAERVGFLLEFEQPYRVPIGAAVTPPIKIAVKDKVLENPSYRLEAAGIVRVDSTGRGLLGLARGTTSVRLVYATATGAPDTAFDVQVVVSGVALDTFVRPLTRLRDSTTLTARALDATGAVVPVPAFRWRSSNPEVATVDSSRGVVTAIDEGTASITAEVDQVSGSASVTVVQVAAAVGVAPELDTLRTVGRSVDFFALAFDSTGRVISTARPRWTSSDLAVATVNTQGRATAAGAGKALIIARVGQVADTATLVVAQVARYIFVTPSLDTLTAIDDTTRLVAQALDSLQSAIPNPLVTWTINDATIATVEQTGVVRAKKNGAVVVIASSGRQSGFGTVVVRQEVAAAQIAQDGVALTGAGDTVRLSATGFDRNGFAVDGAVFTWRSRSPFVASVDTAGLVTARGDGTTGIVATPKMGGQSDTATVSVTGAPRPPGLIAFGSSPGIQVMAADGSGRRVLIGGADWWNYVAADPAWSPDGARLAFTRCGIHTVRSDGSDERWVTPIGSYDCDYNPAWSPDGTKIAFSRGETFGHLIYVVNADGSNERQLEGTGFGYDTNPTWSPDGGKLAFAHPGGIYIMNADGSGAVNLTPGDEPAWSPDGSELAFVRDSDIWLINADGSNARHLTSTNLGFESSPAWSPDGAQIVFVSGLDLYVINRDGTGLRRLTSTDEPEANPSWGPPAPLQATAGAPGGFPGRR